LRSTLSRRQLQGFVRLRRSLERAFFNLAQPSFLSATLLGFFFLDFPLLYFIRDLAPLIELFIRKLPVSFGRDIPDVPSEVQVMIGMFEENLKLAFIWLFLILHPRLDLLQAAL
jgi:hypothetical protein